MEEIKWKVTGKAVTEEGTIITRVGEGTPYKIVSCKKHIPHANGIGTWDHTTFRLYKNGQLVKEWYTLADAKEAASLDE